MKLRITLLILASIVSFNNIQAAENSSEKLTLWYRQPANEWHEALPIGNGRLGAMVYGTVEKELFELNEETLWTGGPHDYNNPGASDYLPQVRELIKEEKFEEALLLGDKHMLGVPKNQQAYQPLGSLAIEFYNQEGIEAYRRDLDMRKGIANVSYSSNGVTYKREAFASFPDNIIVVHLSCDEAGQLSFAIQLDSPHANTVNTNSDKTLVMKGQVSGHETDKLLGEWKGKGTRFEAQIQVLNTDGIISEGDDFISIKKAQHATLIYTAATAYLNYRDVSGDPEARCRGILREASAYSYKELRNRHINDHLRLFDRVRLDLGGKIKKAVPTDERIAALSNGQEDPLLVMQSFQYGRYLLMASSRPGGQPAHLQGIWSNRIRPSWGNKWTLNINAEMNYWPAEVCNLSECHEPLFRLLEELRAPGRETARIHYDCRGFVTHHNTDLWRGTAPDGGFTWGAWPMGAAWLCHHLWQHYEFTQDMDFLEQAYPTMREAAEFFVDYLIKDENGYWVTSPAISFEQGFRMKNGTTGRVCMGPTMDMQILRALFSHCIDASELLKTDKKFRNQMVSMRENLVPTSVNPETGRIREWRDDREPDLLTTGQLAQLWGLSPGYEITPWKNPELAAGAEASLRYRPLRLGSWCSGTRLNFWARLHNGLDYEQTLNAHMQEHVLPNMMSSFSGTLFQIDGNMGMTASVAEALIQSHAGEIHLLPALPPSWTEGNIKGLCARGGFELDLSWSEGKLTNVTVRSKSGNSCIIRYKDFQKTLNTIKDSSYILDSELGINL